MLRKHERPVGKTIPTRCCKMDRLVKVSAQTISCACLFGAVATAQSAVTIYDNTNYGAPSAALGVGTYDRSYLESIGLHDAIQSLQVAPNYKATVCDDAAGPSATQRVLFRDIAGSTLYSSYNWTMGFEFTPSQSMTVAELGVLDLNHNGVMDGSIAIPVGLWTSTGTLLASATVPGNATLSGNSFFATISPVQLNAGTRYVIGAAYSSGSESWGNTGSITTDLNFTHNGGRRDSQAGLNFPGTTTGSVDKYHGPNLRTAVSCEEFTTDTPNLSSYGLSNNISWVKVEKTATAGACDVSSNDLGGNIFVDVDVDGQHDTSETSVDGTANPVTVSAYDNAGFISSAQIDASGNYYFDNIYASRLGDSNPDNDSIRLEFANLPTGYNSSVFGSDSGTTVQFYDAPTCDADLGLTDATAGICQAPADAKLNTFDMAMACGTSLDIAASQRWTFGLADVRNMAFDTSGQTPPMWHHPDWTLDKIGNIQGIAYDAQANIYVTATTHNSNAWEEHPNPGWRHGDIGGGANSAAAAGTIYKIDAVTGQPTVFAQLPQQLTSINLGAVWRAGTSMTRNTGPGLYGIAHDPVRDQLYVANMEDGKIYIVESDGTWSAGSAFDPLTPDTGAAGTPPQGDMVYAIEYYNDRVYYSIRNDAGNNTIIRSVGLNTTTGEFDASTDRQEINQNIAYSNSSAWKAVVSDLEFSDDGKLAVGNGTFHLTYPFMHTNHYAGNSIWTGGFGAWSMAGSYDTSFANETYNTESYGGIDWDDYQGDEDWDAVLWSSSADISVSTSSETDTHGVIGWKYNDIGTTVSSSPGTSNRLWFEYDPTHGDYKGIGNDVEIYRCIPQPATIEIGNYIWLDTDKDGIQDPEEDAIEGVVVELLDSNGTVIATTTTDANGQYYFSGDGAPGQNWVTGGDALQPNSTYTIRITPAGQSVTIAGNSVALTDYLPTTPFLDGSAPADVNDQSNADNLRDSNGVVNGSAVEAAVTTGDSGTHNHTYDFGFVTSYDLALIKQQVSINPTPATLGSQVTYRITVMNQGAATSGSYTVEDIIPAGMSFVSASPNATTAPAVGSNGTVGWVVPNSGELASGDTATFNVVLKIDDVTKSPFKNIAEITADSGDDEDSDPTDNSGSADTFNDDDVSNDQDPGDQDDSDFELLEVDVCNIASPS